jgi:hypothetical protein
LTEYERLKGIVGLQGSALEVSVEVVLKKLGLVFTPTGTNKEDGNLQIKSGYSIPVEIKGHERKGSSERDLRQVIARLDDSSSTQKLRGLLIVNPFFRLTGVEEKGKKVFESSVVEQAKLFGIALLDTRVLLEFLEDHLVNKTNSLSEAIAEGGGLIKYRSSVKR